MDPLVAKSEPLIRQQLDGGREGTGMIHVHINYPTPHLTIHMKSECSDLGKRRKASQRVVNVNASNFVEGLQEFAKSKYRFGSNPMTNDIWLSINLPRREHEVAIVSIVEMILGSHHKPFTDAPIKTHD